MTFIDKQLLWETDAINLKKAQFDVTLKIERYVQTKDLGNKLN